MPVWKASREGIRERQRERERGERRGEGERRRRRGHCVVWDRRGFVCWGWLHHPSVFLWIWSQQHILFCHYLGSWYSSTECCKLAPERRHTHSAPVFDKKNKKINKKFMEDCLNGGILKYEWSYLRETTERWVFYCTAVSHVYHVGSVYYRRSEIRKCKTPLDRPRIDSFGCEWMEDYGKDT